MTFSLPALDVAARLAADHLWQSTLVAGVAAAACVILRRHSARLRHAVYLAASMKFLVPFAALMAIGSAAPWPAPALRDAPVVVTTVWSLGQPFARSTAEPPVIAESAPVGQARVVPVLSILLITWLAGSVVVAVRRSIAVVRARSIGQSSRLLDRGREFESLARLAGAPSGVSLRSSAEPDAPCVLGIVRPVLVWPDGISNRLTDDQLDAIVRHELAHIRRRDNLTSACHAIVEIVFWFHPMVWWLGSRLIEERERAADESVLASGADSAAYAGAILTVCERSIDSAAFGTASIAGSVLSRRMEAIMTFSVPKPSGRVLKMSLLVAATGLVLGPLAAGALNAQSTPAVSRLSGVVTDQMGGLVAGATVTISGSANRSTQTAETDQFGRFAVAGLESGSHELRVSQPGFAPHVAVLTVTPGAQLIADVRLQVGTVSESITLIADGDASRNGSAATETVLRQQAAERPNDVDAQMALAEFLYKEERFDESAIAMNRAAALWAAARPRAETATTRSTTAGGDISAPKLLRRVNPIYPEAARSSGAGGIVILEASITEDGTVQDVHVIRGEPVFQDAAIGAMRQWIYEPTRLNGVPVAVMMTTTIRFSTQ